jgi:hypothetical protein
LKYRRFSRELVIEVGYRRFWQHQTRAEIHTWLTQQLQLSISEREVSNLTMDFMALLRAGQPAHIRSKLKGLKGLIIGLDGMQPEKGTDCLYIVRELQGRVPWRGVVSDAQESIRLAVGRSLKGVPHQACQSHCLREAGQLTFEADRAMKKELKAAFRYALARLHKRIQAWSADDPFRPVLLDYAQAIRSTLLEGGLAPFELGGIKVFEALESLESSLSRCQKKATTSCSAVCW